MVDVLNIVMDLILILVSSWFLFKFLFINFDFEFWLLTFEFGILIFDIDFLFQNLDLLVSYFYSTVWQHSPYTSFANTDKCWIFITIEGDSQFSIYISFIVIAKFKIWT